jgi:hypothetical protein
LFVFAWFFLAKDRLRRVSGVERPEVIDSAKGGRRSESVRVCLRDEDGACEYSDENDAVLGR